MSCIPQLSKRTSRPKAALLVLALAISFQMAARLTVRFSSSATPQRSTMKASSSRTMFQMLEEFGCKWCSPKPHISLYPPTQVERVAVFTQAPAVTLGLGNLPENRPPPVC